MGRHQQEKPPVKAAIVKAATRTHTHTHNNFYVHHSTDPQSDVARALGWAAIYVQDFDAPCVLQFAWISALCCALHRSTSQVIHRSGSFIKCFSCHLSLSSQRSIKFPIISGTEKRCFRIGLSERREAPTQTASRRGQSINRSRRGAMAESIPSVVFSFHIEKHKGEEH